MIQWEKKGKCCDSLHSIYGNYNLRSRLMIVLFIDWLYFISTIRFFLKENDYYVINNKQNCMFILILHFVQMFKYQGRLKKKTEKYSFYIQCLLPYPFPCFFFFPFLLVYLYKEVSLYMYSCNRLWSNSSPLLLLLSP
jgi:hypothetical protein